MYMQAHSVIAKLSFSRQSFLSNGKNFLSRGKTSFSRQLFLFYNQISQLHKSKGRVINMTAEEDKMDDFIRKYLFKGFTYSHECVVSITTLKKKSNNLVCVGECHVMTSML